MKHNRKPAGISFADLVRGPGHMFASATVEAAPLRISPKESLGQLIQLDATARKFFGRLIVKNWAEQVAIEEVDPETWRALGSVIATRMFDPDHLALTPRDPFALLECSLDSPLERSNVGRIQVAPSARGLALVEAILTSEDVTY